MTITTQTGGTMPTFYVIDHVATWGPYDRKQAEQVQRNINAKYGVEEDGEGSCNAIVVTEGQARMLGKL